MKPTINSEKHMRTVSLSTVAENTVFSVRIAEAVADPSTSANVRIGAIVKAVHVEMWYLGSSSQPIFHVSTVEKISSGQDSPTSAEMSDLHAYKNKKNILETSQGLVGDNNTNPIPVFRHWIKIPKGKQRMGLGDSLYLNIAARGEANNDLEVCGMVIYKEYF